MPANDNAERWKEPAPLRRRVVIYKPAKSAMTSGRAGTKQWLLEYEPQSAPFIEPLMGWTGSTDPTAHMLSFRREAAGRVCRVSRLGIRSPRASEANDRADRGNQSSASIATDSVVAH